FEKRAVVGVLEGIDEVALYVNFRHKFSENEDRDHNLRFDHGGALEVADVFGDIVDHNGLSRSGRGPAKPLPNVNSELWSEASGVRPQNQHSGICVVNETEADAVVARHYGVQVIRDALHERLGL